MSLMMDDSIWLILGGALLVFWLVGAHNRLVRLRAEVNQRFNDLAEQLDQYPSLVSNWAMSGQDLSALQSLLGAVHVLDGALHDCKGRLNQAHHLTALALAVEGFNDTWARLAQHSEVAADKQRLTQEMTRCCGLYNQAAELYNHAIGQFPALLLARLLGFHAAHPLDCLK